jgi:peroxiredoxin
MAQLRQEYQQFVDRDAQIVVLNPEDNAEVKAFKESLELPFPMLVDPGHEVAGTYGQEVNLLKLGRMPTLIVLDRAGTVRFEHHANSMMDTAKNSEVLAVLDRLQTAWEARMMAGESKDR